MDSSDAAGNANVYMRIIDGNRFSPYKERNTLQLQIGTSKMENVEFQATYFELFKIENHGIGRVDLSALL